METQENNQALVIREIIETENGFSRVVVDRDVFNLTKGYRPKLPYETAANAKGEGVRIFDFNGDKLYVNYKNTEEDGPTTTFVTTEEVAKKNLFTLEEQRANEPKLAFAF